MATALGLERDRLEFHQHTAQELAHYAKAAFDIQFDFGGTSIMIVVGVALDTMRQMESQMMMRNYEGFLK